MLLLRVSFAILLGSLLSVAGSRASTPEVFPAFKLNRFESEELVELDDFSGSVVILDFFAYWCVPCRKVSSDLEEYIQKFYAAKGGNAAGFPVQVLSMNIEQGRVAKTRQYIKQTGVSLVLDDVGGKVYQSLTGRGIPYVVVLTETAGGRHWEIAYAHTGYEGYEKLRGVIDSIRSNDSKVIRPLDKPTPDVTTPSAHGLEIGTDALWSNDIVLTDTAANHIFTRGSTEFRTLYSYSTLDLDYSPAEEAFVFWRHPMNISESRETLQETIRHTFSDWPSLTLNGALGGYDGYQDYRSLWLNEFYRQEYPDGYIKADPWGVNVGVGMRWEFAPTTGFLQLDYAWQKDEIAPGYEKVPFEPLVRGRDELDTHSVSLMLENILTPSLRSQVMGLVTDTTGRKMRYGAQVSLNWAMAESWVLRSAVGYSQEAPQFEAWFVDETLEMDIDERWYFSLTGRWYKDTGEIDDSLLLSSAAPELETWHVGLGIRWQGVNSAVKLSGGPYFTRYGVLGSYTEPFHNLYRGRDWGIVQLAFTHQF
jgi:thiol-disulfide isomerase/thioredoxin